METTKETEKTYSATYNGWKNYASWNVALWINGNEEIYNLAGQCQSYDEFVQRLRKLSVVETPDGIAFNDSSLDKEALNELIHERE
jgi:hypothetical protein